MNFLKLPQVAERLQCSVHTVRRMIQHGDILAVRLGGVDSGDLRIAENELERFGLHGSRAVATAYETVATEAASCAPKRSTVDTLRGGRRHA